MGVFALNITTTEGLTFVQAAKIANVHILGVKREGTGYNVVTGSLGSRDVSYDSGLGRITFINPFTAYVSGGRTITEKVFVLYKT